jgi:hypothetical protein
MIYSVATPKGIDVPIKTLQSFLHTKLRTLWSLTEDQIRAFGRAYKDSKGLKFFNNGYLDADGFQDDKYPVQFFFKESDRREYSESRFSVPVEIYFFVDLSMVKPLITTTLADEEVKQDVFNIVLQGSQNFQAFDVVDLEGFKDKMNLFPNHSFKVVTNLNYRYDKTF